MPSLGESFDVLRAQTLSGAFSALDLTPGAGISWQVSYLADVIGTTDVVRLTVSSVPEPSAACLLALGLFALTFARRLA